MKTGKQISIAEFSQAIKDLPSDMLVDYPRTLYTTCKEHWLGWLGSLEKPHTITSKKGTTWDARSAYNHVGFPELLLYLIRAIPLKTERIKAAERANERGSNRVEKLNAIRKAVPWSEIYQAIWEKGSEETGGPKSEAKSEHVQNLALSIHQPYAEQILRGTKKIEYRTRVCHIRGRVYLYATQKPDLAAYKEMGIEPESLPTGFIVGTMVIEDCDGYDDDYEWHLARPERLDRPITPQNHPQPVWFIPFEEKE